MMKRNVVFLIFVCITFGVTTATYAATANVENLLAAFESKNIDRVLSSLNDIKRSRYKGDILPLLDALWNKDKEAASQVPQEMLDYDIIRIQIADILVQAHNNGLIEAPVNDIHAFARKLLKSSDKEVVASTVFVLAQIDDQEDVNEIEGVALNNKGYLFRSSVIALSMMCNSAADRALKRIGEVTSDSEQTQFVRETRIKFSNLKYCSQKSTRNR